jgi:hypothetical protein
VNHPDRKLQEDRLEEVEGHVRLGREHIDRQHQIIADLKSSGSDSALAEDLLHTFEAMQMAHEADRDRLIHELRAS